MRNNSVESRALRMQRFEIEEKEDWDGWCARIPAISMKPDWRVRILPPFSGAMVRFSIRRGEASVSVYLDVFERLGCFGHGDEPVPHWEIWPAADGDNWRCPMEDVDALLDAIEDSLERQERDRKPREPVTPMKLADAPPFMGNGAWYRPRGQDEWIRLDDLCDLSIVMPEHSHTIDGLNIARPKASANIGWTTSNNITSEEDEDGWTTIIGDAGYVDSEINRYIARLTADADKEDT